MDLLLNEIEYHFNNYFILIIIFFILILIAKFFFIVKPKIHNRQVQIGNMQVIGEQTYQNDYFTSIIKKDISFAVIADGLSDKRSGKFASVIAVEILKKNFNDELYKKLGVDDYFNESFELIRKRLKDETCGNNLGVMIICILILNKTLHFASIGNCSLFLYRDGEMIHVNDIYSKKIQISKISIKRDDVVMLCSKGARESLTEMEMLCQLSGENHPYAKCQNLARQIQRKHLVYQQNTTILILEEIM